MSTVIEAIRSKGTSDKGTDKGTEEEDVKKGTAKGSDKGTEGKAEDGGVDALFDDGDDEKTLKWRFLAKGDALAAILAVFGAKAVEGPKQVSFVVSGSKADRELGDVVRGYFLKAHAAGVTLGDLLGLLNKGKK